MHPGLPVTDDDISVTCTDTGQDCSEQSGEVTISVSYERHMPLPYWKGQVHHAQVSSERHRDPPARAMVIPLESRPRPAQSLLGIEPLSKADISRFLDQAAAFKAKPPVPSLRDRLVVNLFFEASTCTRELLRDRRQEARCLRWST